MKRALAIAALACTTCGPKVRMLPRDAPVPWDASGVDWTKPPPLGVPVPFAPAAPQVVSLANGVRVIVIENHRLPLVAVSIVHADAGSRVDADKPGLAALTAELLDEGAGQQSRAQLRDTLERAGVRYESHIATDYSQMQLVVPSAHLPAAIDTVASMVTAPRFDAAEVSRVRGEWAEQIKTRRQRPRTMAAQVFDHVVFGDHPYAVPAEGNADIVATLTADDVRTYWSQAYRPDQCTVILAGDVRTADARRIVEHAFGGWSANGTTSSTRHVAPRPRAPRPRVDRYTPQLVLVALPGARQSVVLIGTRAAPAGDSNQLVDSVATAIVGGGTGARLDRELHDKLGLTLGASASYWRGRWAGSWTAATTFATDKTLAGIRAALRVIDETRAAITDDDLARAKANLLSGAQQSFETTETTARALERVVVQDLPLDWYSTYVKRLAAITLAEVRAASTWQDLSIVVVGDRAALEPALRELPLPLSIMFPAGTKP